MRMLRWRTECCWQLLPIRALAYPRCATKSAERAWTLTGRSKTCAKRERLLIKSKERLTAMSQPNQRKTTGRQARDMRRDRDILSQPQTLETARGPGSRDLR